MQSKFIFTILFLTSLIFSHSINIPESKCSKGSNILDSISNLPQCVVETIVSTIANGLVYSSNQFYTFSLKFLNTVPDINYFCTAYEKVMTVFESLYTIMLMGLGLYYIVNSADPVGRAKAKLWLKNILTMIVFLSLSFTLFDLIIKTNQYLNSSLTSGFDFSINLSVTNLVFGFVFGIVLCLTSLFTFLTLTVRYLMIPLLLFIFPFAICLYFIPPLKGWGFFLLQFIFLIIFMTTVDSLLILALSSIFGSPDALLTDSFIHAFAFLVGFGLIGFVNVIIYLVAILSILNKASEGFGSVLSAAGKIALIASLV